jgi:uncharacterized protein (UPF0332 family)
MSYSERDREELRHNLSKNVLELFVLPEVNRREAAGKLPANFKVLAVQVIMEVDSKPEVRLNEEVLAAAYLRDGASPPAGVGGSVSIMEALADIEELGLGPDDHPNAGHITMVMTSRGWSIWFDLRYNGARVVELVGSAEQFYEAADRSLAARLFRPFIADLFSAVELLAKARLLLHPDERLLETRRHGFTHSEFNKFTKLGNSDPRFAKLLNRLTPLRDKARYSMEPFSVTEEEATEMLATAKEMLLAIEEVLPRRARRKLSRTRGVSLPVAQNE